LQVADDEVSTGRNERITSCSAINPDHFSEATSPTGCYSADGVFDYGAITWRHV
jgi:hypothetical protein